ncbi:phytanoyl-CoA dioxygenase family protein [Streptomyces sp. NPDC058534]|uniref:phytanoyl-CoA dioxygenase family protein n=1 Tax=Streptomyces sp. NPDC058534 TaxID=3346541 RepID=UPI003660ABCB
MGNNRFDAAAGSGTAVPELGAADIKQFDEDGYLVLPGFLPAPLVERTKAEVDHWVDSGLRERSIASAVSPEAHGIPPLMELEMEAHGRLLVHPPLLAVLAQLLGPAFAFHHLHSDRRPPGSPGKDWHHDYEQEPQGERTHVMVHALHYLGGLNASVGGLALLPGSHRQTAEKTARAHLGTVEVPGEVFIGELQPGSTVLIHSALFHTRRAAPRGESRERYMVDSSYVQGGVRWPPAKPYWRHMLGRARELGLAGDRWPDLFAEHHFTEYRPAGPASGARQGPEAGA